MATRAQDIWQALDDAGILAETERMPGGSMRSERDRTAVWWHEDRGVDGHGEPDGWIATEWIDDVAETTAWFATRGKCIAWVASRLAGTE